MHAVSQILQVMSHLRTTISLTQTNDFGNPMFNADDPAYEDVDLDDQEYETVTSSKWDIAWKDLNLSEQILGKGNFGEVRLGKVWIRDKWIKAAVKTLKGD